MSKTTLEFNQMLRDTQRMPLLGDRVKLSAEALRLVINNEELQVETLKVRVADIQDDCVILEFAFCNAQDETIVNIGRRTMRREGVLTLTSITNALHFHVD